MIDMYCEIRYTNKCELKYKLLKARKNNPDSNTVETKRVNA